MMNNERNSRKRLNSLILLVAFTAIMLIVSTYAWFSSQKNVTLSGLKGEVNVAEGLQISLDAEHWVNTINFDHFNQNTNGAWTVKSDSPTTYLGDSSYTFQSPRGTSGGITNITPDELLPLSTTGYDSTGDGIGETALKFYDGTNTETIKLMDDTHLVTENAEAGYFAFDVYVMNTSAGSEQDVIQLDPNSDVTGDNESTGVQNTARVAFALYNNNNDGSGFDASTAAAGSNMTISGSNELTPAQIIAGTSTGKTIKDIAIWEPNADKHTDTIVSSLANSLKLDATEQAKWTGLAAQDANTKVSKFTATQYLPTYALTSTSVGTGDADKVLIADVYDWRVNDSSSTAAKGVKKQYTLQTASYDAEGSNSATLRATSVNLVSTKKVEAFMTDTARETDNKTEADVTDNTFTLNPSQYAKIRIYFWMEGQDPDCINAASLGGGLTLDIGFSKPGSDSSAVSGS